MSAIRGLVEMMRARLAEWRPPKPDPAGLAREEAAEEKVLQKIEAHAEESLEIVGRRDPALKAKIDAAVSRRKFELERDLLTHQDGPWP